MLHQAFRTDIQAHPAVGREYRRARPAADVAVFHGHQRYGCRLRRMHQPAGQHGPNHHYGTNALHLAPCLLLLLPATYGYSPLTGRAVKQYQPRMQCVAAGRWWCLSSQRQDSE